MSVAGRVLDHGRVVCPLAREEHEMRLWLGAVFFLSGGVALVYQLVWQRALFAMYGLEVVSVTLVVTSFLLGLGLGSLAGGVLSRAYSDVQLPLFAFLEFGIGLFGFFSLDLFARVAQWTTGIGHTATGLVAFLLVVIPTTCMGATLPLLVAYTTRLSGNVGRSVSTLYFLNTVGAAGGAYLAATVLLSEFGLTGTAQTAAGLNVGLAVVVVAMTALERRLA